MFETCLLRKFALNWRTGLIILFILPPNYVCKLANTEIDAASCSHGCPTYTKRNWTLAPLGKAASEVINAFFGDSTSKAIQSTVGVQNYRKYVFGVIGQVFMHQISVVIIVIISCLVILLLLLAPYFVGLFRSRQIALAKERQADDSWRESRRKACLISEFVVIFFGISIFGAVIMPISAVNFDDNIRLVFNYSISAVSTSFVIQHTIQESYLYKLGDFDNSILKVMSSMYKISVNTSNDFMNKFLSRVDTIGYLRGSVLSNIRSIEESLKNDKKDFEYLLSSTYGTVTNNTLEYRSALYALKSIFDKEDDQKIFGPVVDPLINFPDYTLPFITSAIYDYSLWKLDYLSKLDVLIRTENFEKPLRSITDVSDYDPSWVKSQLSQIALNTKLTISNRVRDYVAFIKYIFRNEDENVTIREMKNMQADTMKHFGIISVSILVFSIVGIVLSSFFLLVYCLGIIGTNGFKLPPPGTSFVKSSLSHMSGKIIVVSTYFAVVILAIFWAFGTFLFLLSGVPSQLCSSALNGLLLSATIDHPSLRNNDKWYNMYSSKKFNISLRDNIIKCNKNLSYFSFLDNFEVNKSLFDSIKATIDLRNIRSEVESATHNYAYINIFESDKTAFDVQGVNNINVRPFFKSTNEFLSILINTNSSKVLTRIKDHSSSSEKLKNAAIKALKSYKKLAEGLSSLKIRENDFNFALKNYEERLSLAKLDFDGFILSAETFDTFIRNNATNIYMSVLHSVINKNIDDCYHNLNSSVEKFRKMLSFCSELLYHYNYFLYIVCESVLYPVSLCWLGAFFVNVFFLLSLFLCLYSVNYFLIPPKCILPEIPQTVLAEDLPSTSEAKVFISHFLKPEIDIPAEEAHSTTEDGKSTTDSESSSSDSDLYSTAAKPDDSSQSKDEELPSSVSSKLKSVGSSSNFVEDVEDAKRDEDHGQIRSEKSTSSMKSESNVKNAEKEAEKNPKVDDESTQDVS